MPERKPPSTNTDPLGSRSRRLRLRESSSPAIHLPSHPAALANGVVAHCWLTVLVQHHIHIAILRERAHGPARRQRCTLTTSATAPAADRTALGQTPLNRQAYVDYDWHWYCKLTGLGIDPRKVGSSPGRLKCDPDDCQPSPWCVCENARFRLDHQRSTSSQLVQVTSEH